ncbi:subtilisin-like protein [Wolfiporia cocos MD-104 SS10]|uniref:tripeptidyl-peptidase II n=1 Tax=Wolfiporia cocos (strain MD-104) TaxID=742152 RepID=A0A2H3J0P5_WOLCO|nr:subtilisin-like protein [Wolfiporia cocos MD-104 SS10]
MASASLMLALLSLGALGKHLQRDLQIHEFRESIPTGYTLTGPASSDAMIDLRIALVQNDTAGLIDALYDVSTPSSSDYGKHLSKEEVEASVTPKAESVSAVHSWLNENGVNATTISPAGDWLSVQLPVGKANEMLGAEYSMFTHAGSGTQAVRTLSYSIPVDLQDHIDLVHPTVTFPNPHGHTLGIGASLRAKQTMAKMKRNVAASSPCANISSITPSCLQYLYNIPATPATNDSNHLAVTGYVDQWANLDDLQTFLKTYRPDMNSSTAFSLQTVDGGTNNQTAADAGIEANLDIQYTLGIATDVPITFISVGGNDFHEALLDTAYFLLNETSVPQVVTTSYGDAEYLVSQKLAYNLCNAYAQLGARGVSVIFASGDGGVSGLHYPYDGCTTFIPTFPSGCPYVTSVGGTVDIPQTAVSFSSGGFSNYWSRPSYQGSAVESYLSVLGSNDTGLYNASGRGFPDVAAYAVDFAVVADGKTLPINGTSCAAPTFASMISLLNDQLIGAGKPVLGFLNPFLYSTGLSALNDITIGDNLACSNYTTGFYAGPGWDPVTGLGTPDFARLRSAVGL